MWRITQELPRAGSDFDYGGFTLCAAAFHPLHLSLRSPTTGSYNPGSKLPVWAFPLSLATTYGIDSLSFPPVTEMFHFTGYRVLFPAFPLLGPLRAPAGFRKRRWLITTIRLPHSEISGSKRICRSPKLIAAYHVLHRLLAPRHSLCALKSLIPCLKSATRTCQIRDRGSWIADLSDWQFPRFVSLATHLLPFLRREEDFAVKIDVFGNQNIFKDRKNSSQDVTPAIVDCSTLQFLAVNQIIFLSIWMSKSGLRISSAEKPCGWENSPSSPRLRRAFFAFSEKWWA